MATVPGAAVAGAVASFTVPLTITVSLGTPHQPLAVPASAPSPAVGAVGEPDADDVVVGLAELGRSRGRTYYERERDDAARAAYYEPLDAAVNFATVSDLIRSTHRLQVRYSPSRELYPWVDLQPDKRSVRSLYSGMTFAAETFIVQDAATGRRRAVEAARVESTVPVEELEERLEALLPFNCEHVVPQSWFGKREPMRGDLHHLFACESGCNSFRGNTPYFDFVDFDEVVRDACGRREAGRFEPGAGKGAAARSTLYFLLRYPGQINATASEYTADRVELLKGWHAADAPGEWELHRNQAIHDRQGNRNPLIDHPAWVERIDFSAGLG